MAQSWLVVGEVKGSNLSPNGVIIKDVKNCFYCWYARCATYIVRVGGVPWSINRCNQYFLDKSHAIKGLVCLLDVI